MSKSKTYLLILALAVLLLGGFLFIRFNRQTVRSLLPIRLFFRNDRMNRSRIISPSPGQISSVPSMPAITQNPSTSSNPFGVMLAQNMPVSDRINLAKSLGVVYYRPTNVKVDSDDLICDDCDEANLIGLKLILTIRNGGGMGNPSTPPGDLNAYKNRVARVLDMYKPYLLVVENEENSGALFYSGTPSQYHQELLAACSVAHSKGYKCTNGGLVSGEVALLVADSYKAGGNAQKADDYLKRTLSSDKYNQYIRNPNAQRIVEAVQKGKDLLAGYKANGADYVNFHWYVADIAALGEAVSFLQDATGLPALTNEVGQQLNTDPGQVTSVMQEIVNLRLPVAVWFSMDIQGFAGARGLNESDGTIRPNGEAFKNFISENF
ncbi:hypothetical protein HY338_01705 [Candidatus Gottesmanbacteria bacterium]|nr:hypothetical protein [Candidatus Gottesmanbacteria bacterium]